MCAQSALGLSAGSNFAYNASPYHERDLSYTPRDENSAPRSVRRSFSWGKKKKRVESKAATRGDGKTEVVTVLVGRTQAQAELGIELHAVTGDVIVSHAGQIADLCIGDCLLSVQGLELLYPGGDDKLEAARATLRDPLDPESGAPSSIVELTVEKHTTRVEVLKRHAALRGTSLDKLGLTLQMDADGSRVVLCGLDGLAAKSGRCAIGDVLLAVGGVRVHDLETAVGLLQSDALEVELEFAYGFLPPKDADFDATLGVYVERRPVSGLQLVRRSLSFGKKKRSAGGGGGEPTPRLAESASSSARDPSSRDPSPRELDTETRLVTAPKNDEGRIMVTYKVHAVTGELMVAMVGADSPAERAGVEVGDRVLAIQGEVLEAGGEDDLEAARIALGRTARQRTVDMVLQKRVRREVLEFGQEWVGGPRTKLGLTFFSFPDDIAVRVTAVSGAAAKSGRIALGDRILSVNGIRVNHAATLSQHIAEICKREDYVEFEIALGWQAEEGVWYGKEAERDDGEKRKPKRSFSFGRRPAH